MVLRWLCRIFLCLIGTSAKKIKMIFFRSSCHMHVSPLFFKSFWHISDAAEMDGNKFFINIVFSHFPGFFLYTFSISKIFMGWFFIIFFKVLFHWSNKSKLNKNRVCEHSRDTLLFYREKLLYYIENFFFANVFIVFYISIVAINAGIIQIKTAKKVSHFLQHLVSVILPIAKYHRYEDCMYTAYHIQS